MNVNDRTAEQLANAACDIVESNAQSAVNYAHAYGHEGRTLVIDGSMLSPSTRALPYGAQAWEMGDDAWQAFDDIANDRLDGFELTDPDDDIWFLLWDEGCLFAVAPTFAD